VYGPVRTVVWEDGGREAPSYPILLRTPAKRFPLGRGLRPRPLGWRGGLAWWRGSQTR